MCRRGGEDESYTNPGRGAKGFSPEDQTYATPG